MKNFPHQVNRIDRFTQGLAVFSTLAEKDADLRDDGVVGDALARAGAYHFRGHTDTEKVEELLEAEHAKSPSDQGTRTMARELRRTFEGLGLLSPVAGVLRPTPDALRLLELDSDPAAPEAHAIWRRAFHDLEITDLDGTSHPYEILLRLAGERPGIQKGLLGLALEARDDSEAEFQRLIALVDDDATAPAWEKLGVSSAQRANSIKILPAVAEQLREVVIVDGRAYVALQDPLEPREESRRRSTGAVRSRRRRYDRNRDRGNRPKIPQTTTRSYDPDLSAIRYRSHEECLAAFDALIVTSFDRWEGDYDLAVESGADLLLAEVKTIRTDADNQVRLGLGQLLYYEHFDVRPDWPDATISRLLVVDAELDQELQVFLEANEIGLVCRLPRGIWTASTRAAQALASFGVSF
jgi:hypothetical protein